MKTSRRRSLNLSRVDVIEHLENADVIEHIENIPETFDMYPLYWTTSKEGVFMR